MNGGIDQAALEALLAFYVEAGIDCALDEAPHDRFAEPDAAPRAPAPVVVPAAPAVAVRPADRAPPAQGPGAESLGAAADDVARLAGALARSAGTLQELEAALADFEGCTLKRTARQLAFADGTPTARVMFVGEAPGADEDRIGRPFVGRAGQLLDRMLAAIELDRTAVYIANIVPWRPPGNRTPTPQEAAICRPFIDRQIELADPDILVCLGGPAAQALLGIREGILRARGRWCDYHTGTRPIRGFATLHPAYLLRSPLQKRLAWRDFRAIRRALAEPGTS
ncbi:uracil-DNA glycosylase [Chelatococcus reniformis]|uniref:Type-4 uracil-DNA glycosylase n=1 Tax=Chelatococcus reniformis TaxID=1494448 RepID=A0A916U6W8_9HYPH|nr:uracil-DNA glycosylase [Chelatococcus reniformis]GGC62614.1 uracil-DNA glycosylase [Chelatococcus reniformis]